MRLSLHLLALVSFCRLHLPVAALPPVHSESPLVLTPQPDPDPQVHSFPVLASPTPAHTAILANPSVANGSPPLPLSQLLHPAPTVPAQPSVTSPNPASSELGPAARDSNVQSSFGAPFEPDFKQPNLDASASPNSVIAAYYVDWASDVLSPEKVDFNRYDWIDFAFAILDSSYALKFTQSNSEDLLRRLVTAAHAKNKRVKLSVGGWTGSKYFSKAVASSSGRNTLADNMVAAYNRYKLDGIDIDWEYPGRQGMSGNIVSSADTANFLTFLQLLRSKLPASAYITAAVADFTFAGSDGKPVKNVQGFANVLDWVMIMNYDVWGSSSTPGPNAPLSNACGNSTQPMASAKAGIEAWSSAGMPRNKILLGVPSYGYISRSTAPRLRGRELRTRALADSKRHNHPSIRQRQEADDAQAPWADSNVPTDDSNWESSPGGPVEESAKYVTVRNDEGGTSDGQVQFASLVKQGALKRSGTVVQDIPNYVGTGGFERRWDACSMTPFVRSTSAKQVITYDDPESVRLKARMARQMGIRGLNMFDAHGDTSSLELIDAVRDGFGRT